MYYSKTYSNKLKKFVVIQEDVEGWLDVYYEEKISKDLISNILSFVRKDSPEHKKSLPLRTERINKTNEWLRERQDIGREAKIIEWDFKDGYEDIIQESFVKPLITRWHKLRNKKINKNLYDVLSVLFNDIEMINEKFKWGYGSTRLNNIEDSVFTKMMKCKNI